MVEVDNCLIYEFYNVVKFLASKRILAEVFINAEVICDRSGRKGKDAVGAHNNFFFSQYKGNFETLLPGR